MHFEKIMNTLYSFAAAVVIFGAWAKLEHRDYGSLALTIGLLTETGIFLVYGLMEWNKEPTQPPPSPQKTDGHAEDLTDTLQETNRLLNKVFRTE